MAQTLPNPITAAMLAPANPAAGYPRYNTPGDWSGAVLGDDVDQATANVALATASGAAAYPDYTPRHQTAKAAAMTPAGSLVVDVARPRGWIAPNQPYQGNASPPAAPVVTSISPTTGAQATLPVLVTITGTGFSPFSVVKTGGSNVPDPAARYVSATTMTVPVWKASPGTVSVVVADHDVDSNANVVFTVT